ncbi:histidine--tRNA ligase [Agriterribacter sp.]|uniref:histidine--tRNA ligase n=1 Tax=Agriterribacter sp. TaxID=2821509 RepID=UPI002B9AFDD6|nr:histidine--tRNA ligase [Agriterribacter sp.]HRO47402.1 histidine--tRNA ligase [Agriterribacter sp.]HRQ16596.1 histidine--tRNA ligase [Agriterribacter sp.]
MSKASIPQGTRDFSASVVRKRNHIIHIIKNVFELYGFEPLETPAMENLDTLMGKYGEEGDKLIFKILNNGLSDPKNTDKARTAFENVLQGKNDKNLTERALKYDLTIPFARYVAMNHGQLTFPFKRYQVQPVWRADRPQKGRYREFYQCDADVVGSTSLLNEVELANIYATVFRKLKIDVDIKINSRKILSALAELCGGTDKLTDITIAIDKLDKIGIEKVKEELLQRGLNENQVAIIGQYLDIDGDNTEKINKIRELLGTSITGVKGIEELEYILHYLPSANIIQELSIDFTLARGLNYYTGTIFEVKAKNVQMGSIGGGGRYDDLTGLFDVPGIPGVGISFGIDRIYDVMEELKLFPQEVHSGTQVLFFNLGEAESKKAFSLMQELRDRGISCELYHQQAKFDRQFKYAERKHIAYAIMIGSRELESNTCVIKKLGTGEQTAVALPDLPHYSF